MEIVSLDSAGKALSFGNRSNTHRFSGFKKIGF
jgi:hypothetical protein